MPQNNSVGGRITLCDLLLRTVVEITLTASPSFVEHKKDGRSISLAFPRCFPRAHRWFVAGTAEGLVHLYFEIPVMSNCCFPALTMIVL